MQNNPVRYIAKELNIKETKVRKTLRKLGYKAPYTFEDTIESQLVLRIQNEVTKIKTKNEFIKYLTSEDKINRTNLPDETVDYIRKAYTLGDLSFKDLSEAEFVESNLVIYLEGDYDSIELKFTQE